ncbi:MAG: bifunctional diguanylate cyclase/phosphodiesterase [Clostridium sp.]|nr:bifunctional diguanylate cyclase/phosphodiesterase [Clostridium sp.]MCM1399726.1 bifunctional diguanylate cyclase/phosphodiesterase [Clostridium sp.]MCM1460439.1 bifunctional diguanylate cyclase/phosphodiesterase [Bacteroides sp.]
MAEWNVAFDYVAFYIMFVIAAWYVIEKKIPLKNYVAFRLLVYTALIATSLEILATHMMRQQMDSTVIYHLIAAETFIIHMLAVLFVKYSFSLSRLKDAAMNRIRLALMAVVAVELVLAVANYNTGILFTVEGGRYIAHGGTVFLAIVDFIMLCLAMYNMIKYVTDISVFKSVTIVLNILVVLVAAYAQVVLGVPVLNSTIATLLLTLCHYLHNPDTVKDQTTQLFNRKMLGKYVANLYEQKKSFEIIMVAMDDFKFINKTYGARVGDKLLLEVGNYLTQVDAQKYVFRFGSDQFCIVLDKKGQNLDEIVDDIINRFRHPWYGDTEIGIMMSASICCVNCPKDAPDYGSLVEVIDYSMAVAKKSRKGMVSKVENLELEKLKREKDIEKALRLAMDRDEFMVYYQPIFSIKKGKYSSAEALVRMNDEELGWVSPEDFIPIAEKNGLIVSMGEMILEKVCKFIRDYDIMETSIEYIEVNISSVQLMQLDFVDRVKSILEKYDVKPQHINMEITETATMGNMTIINKNIEQLVEYGINFSLDDYGSGNANIDYINHMPFKIIKLDKYIIWDAFKDLKAGVTLKYTIQMLNELELLIVAEGVETAEMKDKLVAAGCHHMQGWYYSKAVCDEDFKKLLSA